VIDAARAGKTGDIATYLTSLTGTEKFSVAPVTATCRLRQLGKSDDKAVDFTLSWTGVDPGSHVRIGLAANTKPLYVESIGRSQEGAGLLGATTCLAFAGVDTAVTDLVVFAGPNYKTLSAFKVKAT
jgi:hypothetical protein